MTSRTRVLFAIFANPAAYPPVERAARLLRDADASVRVLGTVGDATDAFDPRRDPELDVRVRGRGQGRVAGKLGYAAFLLWALVHLARWRPHWVYASDLLATPLALIARYFGVRVLYHEHDLPDDRDATAFVRVLLAVRRRVVREADIVVTPNAERTGVLRAIRGARPSLTVWNCPVPSEVRSHMNVEAGGELRVIYQGSLSAARLPLTVIEAIAAARVPVALYIRAYETVGSRGYLDRVVERASSLGVASRVHRLPPCPRDKMLDFAATCDLGLALMPIDSEEPNERTMAGASNKAFEYLACEVPIVVSELPDWRALFVAPGVAFACDPRDPASIARVFELAAGDRSRARAMGSMGRARVETEWNYPAQFAPVLRALLVASDELHPDSRDAAC